MVELSVILPARTGDYRILEAAPKVREWLEGKSGELVIEVDDQGKGYGVKHGLENAKGTFSAILDVDLPVELDRITESLRVLKWPNFHFHFVQGKRVNRTEPLTRRFLSWGFHQLVQHRTGVKLDTQCGFQVWRTDSARQLLPLTPSNGWTFPIQFYLVAERMGMSTYELPVEYQYEPHSTVHLSRDALEMFMAVMRL